MHRCWLPEPGFEVAGIPEQQNQPPATWHPPCFYIVKHWRMVQGRIIAERTILSLEQMQSWATEQAATLSAPCTLARSGWLCANKPPFWRIRQGKTAQQLFVLLFGLRDANRRRLVRDKTVQELFPGWLHAAISPTTTLAHILHPQPAYFTRWY